MIRDDERSLAPSLTTVYELAYFDAYSKSDEVLKGVGSLPSIVKKSLPLCSTDMSEILPSYKVDSERDSKWKTDSINSLHSHDNRFTSHTAQHTDNDEVETVLTPCRQQPTIMAMNASMSIPVRSSSAEFQSTTDDECTKSTVLCSSNDGYISSDASEYKQCHVSVFSSSDYQPAPSTAKPHLTSSLSDLSTGTELAEEQEAIVGERALDPACSDSYVHPNFGAAVSARDVDSGYKQADLFLTAQLPGHQPSLEENVHVLDETGLLDGFEADWAENIEEGIPQPSSRCAQDSHMTFDSSGYVKDNLTSFPSFELDGHREDQRDLACLPASLQSQSSRQVLLGTDGYLKDGLTSPPSFEAQCSKNGLDAVHFDLLDEQSSRRGLSLDSCGYLKDGLVSPWAVPVHNGQDALDMIHCPGSNLVGTGDVSLQTSMEFGTECGLENGCPLVLVRSGQSSDGCVRAAVHSEQEATSDVHAATQSKRDSSDAVMQSGPDSDGYLDSGLDAFPVLAESAKDLGPFYNCNVREDPSLEANDDTERPFCISGDEYYIESNLGLGNGDDHLKCATLNVESVQLSTLEPTHCSSSFCQVSDNSGYAKSNDFFSVASSGRIAPPLFPNTDDYIYT